MPEPSAQPTVGSLFVADHILALETVGAVIAVVILGLNAGQWGEFPVRYAVTGSLGGLMLLLAVGRYRRYRRLYAQGEEVRATVVGIARRVTQTSTDVGQAYEPTVENELTYTYAYRGQALQGTLDVWGIAGSVMDSSLLKEGDEIILLVDPDRPEQHIVRNRYLPSVKSLLASSQPEAVRDATRAEEARNADAAAVQAFEKKQAESNMLWYHWVAVAAVIVLLIWYAIDDIMVRIMSAGK